MAWIELHQALWTHRKTFALAADLGVDETTAGGHLARFWSWALDNLPDGRADVPDQVIAFGAGWKGDPEVFVQALIAAGWMDATNEGRAIHDWAEYAGRLIEKRAANAQRARTSRERSARVAGLPNRTVPNSTEDPPRAGAREEPPNEPNVATVIAALDEAGVDVKTRRACDWADVWTEPGGEAPPEWVLRAIATARERGRGANLDYITGILRGFIAEGGPPPEQPANGHAHSAGKTPPARVDQWHQGAKELELCRRDTGICDCPDARARAAARGIDWTELVTGAAG